MKKMIKNFKMNTNNMQKKNLRTYDKEKRHSHGGMQKARQNIIVV